MIFLSGYMLLFGRLGNGGGDPNHSSRDIALCSCQLWGMKSSIWICAVSALLVSGLVSVAEGEKTEQKPEAKPPAAAADFTQPAKLTETAPDTFKARFDTTKGPITVTVTRADAPNGADRFYNLVRSGFFKDIAFFRVIPGFMCQFGIHGDPKVSAAWHNANIADDPVKASNTRGAITFATAGPNTRTTQLFINFGDNSQLDHSGFAPFGKVTEGMDVVDKINGEYGEGAPGGRGPNQGQIQAEGNAFLKKDFPNLDYIKSAVIVK
jgi:peptidyl-prolyl cis-trans isomerase A (cyclophilin A)